MKAVYSVTGWCLLLTAAVSAAAEADRAVPEAVTIPEPVYTQAALEAGWNGSCRVGVIVDTDGSVFQAWLIEGSGREDMDQAALEAARDSRWLPATRRGVPLAATIGIPFRFEIGLLPEYLRSAAELSTSTARPPEVEFHPESEISFTYPKELEGAFCLLRLEVDELGLALTADVERSSGDPALDSTLVAEVLRSAWLTPDGRPPLEITAGVYLHIFRRSAPEPVEEPLAIETTDETPDITTPGKGGLYQPETVAPPEEE